MRADISPPSPSVRLTDTHARTHTLTGAAQQSGSPPDPLSSVAAAADMQLTAHGAGECSLRICPSCGHSTSALHWHYIRAAKVWVDKDDSG